jgi:hypothetical protein
VLGKIRKGLGVKRCRPNTSNAFTEIRGLYAKCFLKINKIYGLYVLSLIPPKALVPLGGRRFRHSPGVKIPNTSANKNVRLGVRKC